MTGGRRFTRAARAAFIFYAVALAVATHWPRLEVPSIGVERSDIWIHVMAFAVWTALLVASGLAGDRRSPWTAARAGGIALVYAAVDELTQAIPGVYRHAALDDYLANAVGAAVGMVLALLCFRRPAA